MWKMEVLKISFYHRLYYTIRLCLIRSGSKRGTFLRDKKVMGHVGDKVLFMPRKVPLYPELIKLHDNTRVASGVTFVTHDGIHIMLNNKFKNKNFQEKIGCIEIEENVFVGSNSIIMYDVKIGSNSIIAAGSIVTKDIPDNSIAAGVPAKVIGTLEDFVNRLGHSEASYPIGLKPKGQHVSQELSQLMWDAFYKKRT